MAVLAFLLAPWPHLGEMYGAAATSFGNFLLRALESTRIEAGFVAEDVGFVTVLRVRDVDTRQALQIPIELRTLAFVPAATFVALTFSERLRLTRRAAWRSVIGLCLLHALLLVSMLVPLALFFSDPQPMQLWTLSNFVSWPLIVFYRSFVAPPGMIYVVPFGLWLWLRRREHVASPPRRAAVQQGVASTSANTQGNR